MYKLYDWLTEKLSSHLYSGSMMIDVGAYKGDFTLNLLKTGKFTQALMFEPNHEHFNVLKEKLASHNNIHLYPYALGNQTGSQNFNCSQDDATGSLLPYHPQYHHESSNKKVKSFSVDVVKLDDFCEQHFPNERIGFIKIDTQGFDLEVLKGAEKTIKKHKPWLTIELNFLPFYTSQAPINSVFNWLTECGYNLGGIFNDHYSSDQWLAFADGVFIPNNTVDKVLEPFYPKVFSEELLEQNKYLQSVCDERLELIKRLDSLAGMNLKIANAIKIRSRVKKLKDKVVSWF